MRTFTMLSVAFVVAMGCNPGETRSVGEAEGQGAEAGATEEPPMKMEDVATRSLAPLDEEPEGAAIDVAKVAENQGDYVGEEVTIKWAISAREDTEEHVVVVIGDGAVRCRADMQHAVLFEGLDSGADIQVQGVLSEADGGLLIAQCTKVEEPAADMGAKSVPAVEDEDGVMDGAPEGDN